MYTMQLGGEPYWAPLERLADEMRARRRPLRLDDYTYVGREVAPGCPDIHLYAALDTRRFLNLDETGGAYRYRSPPVGDPAGVTEYLPLSDVESAVRWARWRGPDRLASSADRRPEADRAGRRRLP